MNAAESIRKLLAKAARLADGQPIKEIHVLLGDQTGLTLSQVQAAFDQARPGTLAAEAVLCVRRESGRALCLTCEAEWPVQALNEACPVCGSRRTHMVAGHRVHLASLTFAGQNYRRGQHGQPRRNGATPRAGEAVPVRREDASGGT